MSEKVEEMGGEDDKEIAENKEEGEVAVKNETVESDEATLQESNQVTGVEPIESQPKDQPKPKDHPEEERSAPKATDEEDVSKQIYHVKWICSPIFNGKCPIITQNLNGPCPLIGMINVLFLRGKLRLPLEGCEVVSSEKLLEMVADLILSSTSSSMTDAVSRLDLEQNMNDAIALLPKLQTGLDVNVKFSGVTHLEYTDTCVPFDLLNISLYHGWLTDPQDKAVHEFISPLSYNQLADKIITYNSSGDEDKLRQSKIGSNFLRETASQLTYHGLCELNTSMREDELAVFFRNNHFSTIFKHEGELFVLLSDQGFLKEPDMVWETLCTIDGAGHFVDANFVTVPPKNESASAAAASGPATLADEPLTPEQQMNRDHLLAVTLAEEDKAFDARNAEWEEYKKRKLNSPEEEHSGRQTRSLTDEELAKRLQAEEDRKAANLAAANQQQPSSSSTAHQSSADATVPSNSRGRGSVPASGSNRQGNKNCTIL